MKFEKVRRSMSVLAVGLLLASTQPAKASVLGMPDPSGTNNSTWDTYPSVSFSLDTPDTTGGSLFTATLSHSFTLGAGGEWAGSGDRLYSGKFGPGDPSAFNLVVDGTALSTLTTLSLVLKFTSPGLGGTAADFFTLGITGSGTGSNIFSGAEFLGTSVEAGNTFNIYQYTWTNLSVTGGFQVTATSTADHVSLDTVRLTDTSVAAVPEPSTYALMALGLGALFFLRNRRARA